MKKIKIMDNNYIELLKKNNILENDVIHQIFHKNRFFIILDYIKSNCHNNVYCYLNDGYLLWQMEKIDKISNDDIINFIKLENDKSLRAMTGLGEYFIIDINTGKILDTGRGKGMRLW